MGSIGFNSNIASVIAQRYLGTSTREISATFERLASGQRINRASDDAAGLAISSSLNAKARIFSQAYRNGNDAISALGIAQGGLSELTSVVIRLQELATGAANGSLALSQRLSSDTEAFQLVQEFNRIVSTTSFNGRNLIDGALGQLGIQLGIGSDDILGLGLGSSLARNVGTGGFNNYNTNTTAFDPDDPGATADFNGDGYLDVVVSDGGATASGNSYVIFGNGNGRFGSTTTLTLAGGLVLGNQSIAADLNGDGKADVAVASSAGIQVFLGNGDGTFSASTRYSSGLSMTGLAAVDTNHDGILDFVSGRAGNISVLRGNGDGTFATATNYATGLASISSLATGDFNGDGFLDVAAFRSASATVSMMTGNYAGTLTQSVQTTFTGATGWITSGDVNHDGILDLVASGANSIKVMRGNGNGAFGSVASYTVTGAHAVTYLADMNGDGYSELVTGSANALNGYVSVLNNNGDGTFAAAANSRIPSLALVSLSPLIMPGDFNNDGVMDAAWFDGDDHQTTGIMSQRTTKASTIGRIDLTTRAGALSSLDILNAISQRIVSELGSIGAFESRIFSALSTLTTKSENYVAAASRITDADFGFETAELTRQRIKQQAASAVLAQANQLPALALSLLR